MRKGEKRNAESGGENAAPRPAHRTPLLKEANAKANERTEHKRQKQNGNDRAMHHCVYIAEGELAPETVCKRAAIEFLLSSPIARRFRPTTKKN